MCFLLHSDVNYPDIFIISLFLCLHVHLPRSPDLFLPDDVTALTCPLGASYLGYLRKYQRQLYCSQEAQILNQLLWTLLWVYVSYNLCQNVGVSYNNIWVYVTYFSVCVGFHPAECYLSWQRDQHCWWRCSLFLAPAECSSGRSSAPLWTWTVTIQVKSHVCGGL